MEREQKNIEGWIILAQGNFERVWIFKKGIKIRTVFVYLLLFNSQFCSRKDFRQDFTKYSNANKKEKEKK